MQRTKSQTVPCLMALREGQVTGSTPDGKHLAITEESDNRGPRALGSCIAEYTRRGAGLDGRAATARHGKRGEILLEGLSRKIRLRFCAKIKNNNNKKE